MKLIILLLFVFISKTTFAQVIERIDKGYRYDSKEYKTDDEILDLLESSPKAIDTYKEAKSLKSKSKNLGTISILSFASAALLISQYPNPNADSPNVDMLLLGSLAGVVSCITGSVGIVFSLKAKKFMNKKVGEHFKLQMYGERNNQHDIKLNFVSNRIQLIFYF